MSRTSSFISLLFAHQEEEEEDGSMETERIRPTLTFTQGHARKRIHEDAAQDSEVSQAIC